MAGPVPTYLATQLAAQTAFSVPFGLLALVNTAITTATTAGEFNTTVDCSLFTAEDVSNLRIYLDSQGYTVEFAKNSGNKSLLIDWGRFLDIPGTEIVVDQGTTPWIVAGTVTANQGTSPWIVSGSIVTSPDVNVHDGSGNSIGSVGTSLNVDVTNFPATQPVSGTVTVVQPTGSSLHVDVDNFPSSQNVVVTNAPTVNQGTSPWVTSVSNFPATVAVTQSTSPWIVAGTIIADQGTSPWVVAGTVTANAGTGTFLVDGSAHTQPVSGTITANQGTSPWVTSVSNFPATVAVTQSTSPWVVSGTVTANAGTGNFTVVQPTGTNLHTTVDNLPALQSINIFSQSIPVGVQETPATKALYSFGGGVTLAAAATDVFQLRGSGTKTVRILFLELFLTRTTVGSVIVTMLKRSTLDTGGTPLSFNVAPLDSNNANSSAVIDGFATNPTLGTAIGNVCTTILLGEATTTVNQNGWKIDFQTTTLGQGCVLRGAAQGFVINFGGATVAGGALWYNIIWSEE